MKRSIRAVSSLVLALSIAPFLPLYVGRTMTHVMFAHGTGTIESGWKRCTLIQFKSVHHYMHPEQDPALWLAVNVALWVTYALLIASVLDRFLARAWKPEVNAGTKV
jgi:hypothetical protein